LQVYQLLANAVVLLHLGFILFVAAGWIAVARWWRVAFIHLPAVAWGAFVEFRGWYCPLTNLENWLRDQAGVGWYSGGFIDRYVVPIVYPESLSREFQLGLGLAVLAVNGLAYGLLVSRWFRLRRARVTDRPR
jgi:hypothetical protein